MNKPIKTSKGHLYHGASTEDQLKRLRKEVEQLQNRLKQYEDNKRTYTMMKLTQAIEALGHVAAFGWKYQGCGSLGMKNGKRGDAVAITEERRLLEKLENEADEISGWLDLREEQIITISKGLEKVS